MPLTIEVLIPAGETEATLTAITGTGTAANPYAITPQGSSQFGTIEVADAANLLGLWQVKVGTRAIHRVTVVAGESDYPLPQYATAANVTAAQTAITTILGTPAGASIAADIAAVEGGGGGDASQATLLLVKAKTDLITSQTANQLTLPSTTLTIVRGDSFSQGVPVDTNFTSYTASFTIRHRVTNAVLVTTSATVTSSTLVTVSLTTSQTAFALLVDPTEFGPHPYDLQFVSGAITATRKGVAIIRQDVTT
jgi:hypothetical protein